MFFYRMCSLIECVSYLPPNSLMHVQEHVAKSATGTSGLPNASQACVPKSMRAGCGKRMCQLCLHVHHHKSKCIQTAHGDARGGGGRGGGADSVGGVGGGGTAPGFGEAPASMGEKRPRGGDEMEVDAELNEEDELLALLAAPARGVGKRKADVCALPSEDEETQVPDVGRDRSASRALGQSVLQVEGTGGGRCERGGA